MDRWLPALQMMWLFFKFGISLIIVVALLRWVGDWIETRL